MAKGPGTTRKSSSNNPKGLNGDSRTKITTSFTGAKFVEGVTPASYTVARIATDLYPGIVSGGSRNSIAFRKNTSDSVIRNYVNDVKALNKIYNKYEAKIKAISKSLASKERLDKELSYDTKRDDEMKSYYKKREKQLNRENG